jgi:hypothetical protein
LRSVGVHVPASDRLLSVAGMTLQDPPHVVLHASFAVTLSQLASRFPSPGSVKISANSTVVLCGDVTVHHLDVDGTLVIQACSGASVGQWSYCAGCAVPIAFVSFHCSMV